MHDLAVLLDSMGEYEKAVPLLRRASDIFRVALGERHPYYMSSLANLASIHSRAGDNAAALTLAKKAMALRKTYLGVKHPLYANSLLSVGNIHSAMGDFKAAAPLYKSALALYRDAVGERHPEYLSCLNCVASLSYASGDAGAALPVAEEAMAVAGAFLRDSASVQSDRMQMLAAGMMRYHLDLRLCLADGPKHPPAAAHALAWKGSVLLRQRQRRLFLRLAADEETRGAAEALQSATRRLAALRFSQAATRAKLEALQKEQEDAQAELARLSEAFRSQREKERPSAEALAASLPEGAVLVDYLFYRRYGVKGGKPTSEGRLLACVHRKGRAPVRVSPEAAADDVERAVREWRGQLQAGKPGAAGADLKKLIWAPLEKHLEGAKAILVSPDGVLGTVPFAALPGKGKGSYLIEDVALAVVPVPSAIPEMMKPVDKGARLGPSLLAVGDLRYEPEEGGAAPPAGEDTRAAARTGREVFGSLPATRAEVLAAEASFRELFKGGTVTPLRKGEATKAAVRKALAGVRYAHLATHGFFAPEEVKSVLAGRGKGQPGERSEVTGWHPLLLSGLALSDANRAPKPGEEDGILTALEVSEMDLTRLELAVLSACETGLGKVAGGEGLLGMQRAFQAAGARSVIASLWKVDDEATRRLMTDFYAAAWDTRKVVSRAEALRQAQLRMLREGRKRGVGPKEEKIEGKGGRLPPYYWAAFVLSGDWR
jgi:CHAT domain-containing protein